MMWVKQGRAGAFEFTAWGRLFSVEIRAPGCSPIRKDLPELARAVFSGLPSGGCRGLVRQVLLPIGCPAPGTEVALITANKTRPLGNRRFIDPEVGLVVTTDADGGFAIDPQPSEIPLRAHAGGGFPSGLRGEHDADTFRPGKS